jgi:phytoene dehydrogenase-like protein
MSIDGQPVRRLRTAATLLDIERARDAVKYRGVAEVPALDARQWTVAHPELAPGGHHVVTVHVHGVSVEATRGWGDAERSTLGDRVVSLLEQAAPGLSVVGRQVLTPADLEARGLQGGHLWHGEITLDQSWVMRPSRALSQYATPISGLYLCSSATHPAPFAVGGSGIEAAEAALEG